MDDGASTSDAPPAVPRDAPASGDESSKNPPGGLAQGKKPTACIVIGMAGSGKTTLMQRLNAHLHEKGNPYYLINLDPAVLETPFGANIDIRDTVNYKEVMRQYSLGPNGGILTALNLFATRFEQVLQLVEAKADKLDYVLLDTPGQIEIFTWSASGAIIAESLASALPTVIVYVVDTPRCTNAVTFMSNMLYACSILYKMKLPLLLVFNKTDVAPHDFALKWMSDFESFAAALQAERTYMGSLAQSMALTLEEFYNSLSSVGVSALTGEGMDEFFTALDAGAEEYERTYAVELREARERKQTREAERQRASLEKMAADGLKAAGASVLLDAQRSRRGGDDDEVEDEDEDEDGEEEDDDGNSRGGALGHAGYTASDERWAVDSGNALSERETEEHQGMLRGGR